MASEIVYIAIGSNIEPERHIPSCMQRLIAHEELAHVAVSSFYESPADGRPDQPNYRNGVVAMTTKIEPLALKFGILRPLEESEGRVRTADKYAPRTIDLDIVFMGERLIESDELTLPDPAIWQYPFVTIPLLEIAPDLRIPGSNERLDERAKPAVAQNLTLDRALTDAVRKGTPNG